MTGVLPANINEQACLINVTTSSAYYLFPYVPENVLIQNSGTVPVYVKVSGNATSPITIPAAATPNATVVSDGWSEVLAGGSSTLRWSSTFKNAPYFYCIASAAATITVKETRGV